MPTNTAHPATLRPDSLLRQCRTERLRRSGPGGQHRNKVETGIRLAHLPTGVTSEATELRSQAKNLDAALMRLRVNLALEVRRPIESESPPSQLWQSRVSGGKVHVSMSHADFPALLAEALDRIDALEYDVRQAASLLDCTTTQLVRFLQKDPRASAWVNAKRKERGLRPLK